MANWSRIISCVACNAGNPADAATCIRCGANIQQAYDELAVVRAANMKPVPPPPRETNEPRIEDLDPFRPRLDALREPAVAPRITATPQFSKFGGLPALPTTLTWPEWKGRPLAFLAQFDLAAYPHGFTQYALPATGVLYLFYDDDEMPWGFDPKDLGSWRILYAPVAPDDCRERPASAELDKNRIYPERYLTYARIETYPPLEDERIDAFHFTDEQCEAYEQLHQSVFEGHAAHHFFGYPSPVQNNEMDLECQMVTNGIDMGGSTVPAPDRWKALQAGRTDWILLLRTFALLLHNDIVMFGVFGEWVYPCCCYAHRTPIH